MSRAHMGLPRAAIGGAGRDRTGDLLNANQALSQLSYSPYAVGNMVVAVRRTFEGRPELPPDEVSRVCPRQF